MRKLRPTRVSDLPKVTSHKVSGRAGIFTSASPDSKVGVVFSPFWSARVGQKGRQE